MSIHPAYVRGMHPSWYRLMLAQNLRAAAAELAASDPASPALALIRRTIERDAPVLTFNGSN